MSEVPNRYYLTFMCFSKRFKNVLVFEKYGYLKSCTSFDWVGREVPSCRKVWLFEKVILGEAREMLRNWKQCFWKCIFCAHLTRPLPEHPLAPFFKMLRETDNSFGFVKFCPLLLTSLNWITSHKFYSIINWNFCIYLVWPIMLHYCFSKKDAEVTKKAVVSLSYMMELGASGSVSVIKKVFFKLYCRCLERASLSLFFNSFIGVRLSEMGCLYYTDCFCCYKRSFCLFIFYKCLFSTLINVVRLTVRVVFVLQ